MTKTMYDSVNPLAIPRNVQMVAGYINGRYKWSDSDWALFPNSEKIRIQVYIPGQSVFDDGDVLDVEANNAQQAQHEAGRWTELRLQHGRRPTIYTSRDTAHFLQYPQTDYWLAHYTNTPHLLAGTVATQYVSYRNYDVSLVQDWWPRTGTPLPPQPIPLPGGKYMILQVVVGGTDGQGNGYVDLFSQDATKVVNVVANPREPKTQGYEGLPVFTGACQVDTSARCVFEHGTPNLPPFTARAYLDT